MKLFIDKKNCCGCGACVNSCSNKAITMKADEYGFLYPSIDQDKCIECGACVKACNYQKDHELKRSFEQKAYAAMAKDDGTLVNAASGGVFFEIAKDIIQKGGIVYGCIFDYDNGSLAPKHVGTDLESTLRKMQGSKYVQSNIGTCYQEALEHLKKGRTVLFSGTPCQIDGLYGFLKGAFFENLYTIDIICHGVPNAQIFQAYIDRMKQKLHGEIVNVNFRDKAYGRGYNGSISYIDKAGAIRKKKMPLQGFSYYKLFLDATICRNNCYYCKYASLRRPGDITIGDYWGIENVHPELLMSNGGEWNSEKGISGVIVNSEKGCDLLSLVASRFKIVKSTTESIRKGNRQLNQPSSANRNRDTILELFKSKGYGSVERACYCKYGIKGILYELWNYIPGKTL